MQNKLLQNMFSRKKISREPSVIQRHLHETRRINIQRIQPRTESLNTKTCRINIYRASPLEKASREHDLQHICLENDLQNQHVDNTAPWISFQNTHPSEETSRKHNPQNKYLEKTPSSIVVYQTAPFIADSRNTAEYIQRTNILLI